MKNMTKKLIRGLIILISGIIVAMLLMIFTYLLPTGRITKNVENSTYSFYKEGTYNRIIAECENTQLDNFTDAIMLSKAMYVGEENAIEKAVNVYSYRTEKGSPAEQLIKYCNERDSQDWEKTSYFQYWHGYLIFLKPLLIFLKYYDIRMINGCLQMLLVVAIIYLMTKRKLEKFILPFCIALFVISPITTGMSMQFSSVLYIFLIAMIVMLLFHEKLKNKYGYFFLIIGMMTSFFDLLTYPVATFGIPIILFFILENKSLKEGIKDLIIYGLAWIVGYAGMWAGKWILSSILLKENMFIPAIEKMMERTGNETINGNFTRLTVLKLNTKMITNVPNILITVIYIIYLSIKAIIQRVKISFKNIKNVLCFILIATIPIAWYIVAGQHSIIHYWFTYRSLIVTAFAGLVFITILLSKKEIREE